MTIQTTQTIPPARSYRLRLLLLGRTQRELLDAIREQGEKCARTELSEALSGSLLSPKGFRLREQAERQLRRWEAEERDEREE